MVLAYLAVWVAKQVSYAELNGTVVREFGPNRRQDVCVRLYARSCLWVEVTYVGDGEIRWGQKATASCELLSLTMKLEQ